MPTCPSAVLRRCHRRPSGCLRANGAFRRNANRKLIDAWFPALCAVCGDTTGLTVLERRNARSVQLELLTLLYGDEPGLAAELLQNLVVRRHELGGSGRTGRPAWQSPYGPPPHRAHRGRWARGPVVARSRSAVRRGYLCGRCD
ncbi:MAG TPA: DUF1062 domain-containing protein [Streptomyces sp.]|nr:DUF1062 domain-containing protein [Streptomyces sp.]